MILTLSLSELASCCTKSLRAHRTASGSISAIEIGASILPGDMERSRNGDLARSGEPVRGIGLPRPSVVVAYVFSKPAWGRIH